MTRKLAAASALTLLTLLLQPARADDDGKPDGSPASLQGQIETDDGGKQPAADGSDVSVTEHEVTIDGRRIPFTATTGTLELKADDAEAKTKAHVFYVAYTRNDVEDPGRRPLTFAFNGGPGSSSVWLHMGLLGPRRVELPDGAEPARPPYGTVPNEFSLLDVTDVVFVDPVSTGYSRPAKGEKKSQFHGYSEDVNSVAQFVHDYVHRNGRWTSPRYLLGESYGTLRAAGLSGRLRGRYRMDLNGIVLVSSVLDFRTISFGNENDLPCVLFLPAYAATAWYHGKLEKDLQRRPLKDVLALAEEFALEDYSVALLKGDRLGKRKYRKTVARTARLTGLSEDYVAASNLRIRMNRFGHELLKDERKILGRFDSRYTGPMSDPVDDTYSYDASGSAIFPAFAAAVNAHLRTYLDYQREMPYEILTAKVHPWNYERFQNRYVSAANTLRESLLQSAGLKVFVASGYYDLATPYFGTDYTFDHMDLPRERRRNVTTRYYEAGHMMYVHEPSLKRLRKDLLRFYDASDGLRRRGRN